ncbi:MAG: hypothetical protein JNL38_25300 [Myxococcales bacterium]|nr:hypothetical protein [Myxococcales bacterium]
MRRRDLVLTSILSGALAVALIACTTTTESKKKGPLPTTEDFGTDEGDPGDPTKSPDTVTDGGSLGAPSRQSKGETDAGRPTPADAGAPKPDGGATAKVYCTGALAAGDLRVVELMISSRAGSADTGEWVEIQSTRDCWLKLQGLRIESPRGATGVDFVTINSAFELPPNGIFLVADSLDATKNTGLPTQNLFSFESSDVLKNEGDTVTIKMGATVIETRTYPQFSNLEAGRSISFPVDCAWSVIGDWARWSLTFDVYKPGFKGTPGIDNDDVACY